MQIHLNAKLQAYTKAPYHSDWIRDVGNDTLTKLTPEDLVAYLRVKVQVGTDTFGNPVYEYKWYADSNALTTSTKLDEYGNKIDNLFEEVNKHTKSLSNIDLRITNKSTLIWKDSRGIEETLRLPTTSPDKKTIRQVEDSEGNQVLQAMYQSDNTTIVIVPQYGTVSDEFGIHQGVKTGDLFRAKALFTTFLDDKELVNNGILTSEVIARTLSNLKRQVANLANDGVLIDPMPLSYVKQLIGEDNESQWYNDTTVGTCLNNWVNSLSEDKKEGTTVIYLGNGYLYKFTNGLWEKQFVERPVVSNLYTLGLVKSSEQSWKGKVEQDGTFSINGAQAQVEARAKIVSNDSEYEVAYTQTIGNIQGKRTISSEVVNSSIVQRTADGRVKAQKAVDMEDVVNLLTLYDMLATPQDIAMIDTTIGGDN